ncbi:hypothetical protein GCM10008101_28450 [Lysobacter xinjiangensis]|uniref:Uncharacterized protein n=1 Tax=Cognatilysobacter xinjiangensis TaxID=546892 RepID=A0ABQ3C830_9GAMM|nr:hypothetical protein [Lysobacter xinjiangensis]GGZ72346.1 hypothetical protein GCM10008101_28450 [Lysobacter xinjiangensis]
MQRAAEAEITALLGQFFFAFSDFVTALHLCVAWHDSGKGLDQYTAIAGDLGAADLLKRIERQVSKVYASDKSAQQDYLDWLEKAHELRERRNLFAHSRWHTEAYGRYAIAISTPVFVDPPLEHHFSVEVLRGICASIPLLISELSKLRRKYPL